MSEVKEAPKEERSSMSDFFTALDDVCLLNHVFTNGDAIMVFKSSRVFYLENTANRGEAVSYGKKPIEINMEKLARGAESFPNLS